MNINEDVRSVVADFHQKLTHQTSVSLSPRDRKILCTSLDILSKAIDGKKVREQALERAQKHIVDFQSKLGSVSQQASPKLSFFARIIEWVAHFFVPSHAKVNEKIEEAFKKIQEKDANDLETLPKRIEKAEKLLQDYRVAVEIVQKHEIPVQKSLCTILERLSIMQQKKDVEENKNRQCAFIASSILDLENTVNRFPKDEQQYRRDAFRDFIKMLRTFKQYLETGQLDQYQKELPVGLLQFQTGLESTKKRVKDVLEKEIPQQEQHIAAMKARLEHLQQLRANAAPQHAS